MKPLPTALIVITLFTVVSVEDAGKTFNNDSSATEVSYIEDPAVFWI